MCDSYVDRQSCEQEAQPLALDGRKRDRLVVGDRDKLTEQTPSIMELLTGIRASLARLEKLHENAVVKECYTTKEAGERLGRTEWTVRQWCNLGQVLAKKIRGKGRRGEWRLSHEELLRIQNDGPSPQGTFHNDAATHGAGSRRVG